MAPACVGVNLRTGASTGATVRARLSSGTVTVTGSVRGAAWSTVCAGSKAGSAWYRISHVNGKAVSALYGVPVLYAATGVLRAATGSTPAPTPTPKPTPSTAGMTIPGQAVTIFGRGWGHGVGLSQYGARGRAIAGQDAATILAHYYPGRRAGPSRPRRSSGSSSSTISFRTRPTRSPSPAGVGRGPSTAWPACCRPMPACG